MKSLCHFLLILIITLLNYSCSGIEENRVEVVRFLDFEIGMDSVEVDNLVEKMVSEGKIIKRKINCIKYEKDYKGVGFDLEKYNPEQKNFIYCYDFQMENGKILFGNLNFKLVKNYFTDSKVLMAVEILFSEYSQPEQTSSMTIINGYNFASNKNINDDELYQVITLYKEKYQQMIESNPLSNIEQFAYYNNDGESVKIRKGLAGFTGGIPGTGVMSIVYSYDPDYNFSGEQKFKKKRIEIKNDI